MISKSFSKKIITIYSILILIFVGIYIFIFIKIKDYNQNIAYLENEIFLQQDKQQKMSLMNNMIEENKDYIDLVENSVIPKDGNVPFIETIESLASENNLVMTIQSLSFEDSEGLNDKGMTLFKIRSTTKGSWANTYSFLALLEALPLSLKIENLALIYSSTELAGNIRPEWQMSIDMKVLKYK